MKTFYLIDKVSGSLLRRNPDFDHFPGVWKRSGDLPAAALAGGSWVYLEREEFPPFDEETQKLVRDSNFETRYGWDVEALTDEEIEERTPSIDKLTLFRRLQGMGLWGDFKAVIATMDEELRDAWEVTDAVKKTDPLVVAFAGDLQTALGVTPEQMEALLTP
jgi:hypothetical protein